MDFEKPNVPYFKKDYNERELNTFAQSRLSNNTGKHPLVAELMVKIEIVIYILKIVIVQLYC